MKGDRSTNSVRAPTTCTAPRRPLPSASNCILTEAAPHPKSTPSLSLPPLPENDRGSPPLLTANSLSSGSCLMVPQVALPKVTTAQMTTSPRITPMLQALVPSSPAPISQDVTPLAPNLSIDRSQGPLLHPLLCSLLHLISPYKLPSSAPVTHDTLLHTQGSAHSRAQHTVGFSTQ